MIVPPRVTDDFGEQAKPSTTLLTYTLPTRIGSGSTATAAAGGDRPPSAGRR